MMYKLYKVVFQDQSGAIVTEYEYGMDETEALELALGRQGMSVSVKQVKLSNKADLLEAAHSHGARA